MKVTLTRWMGAAVLAATMLVAGGHFAYYMYNWEWVRAQIAGTAFVAALVIAATRLVLDRLSRLERDVTVRLAAIEAAVTAPGARPAPQRSETDANAQSGRPDFPWLAPELAPTRQLVLLPALVVGALTEATPASRPAVFIPMLLAAGLAVSLVAGLVERTAAAVHTPRTGGSGRRLVVGGLVGTAIVALGTAGIWNWVHYEPPPFGRGTTELTVQVRAKTTIRPAEETVELMGRYCAGNAIVGVDVHEVRPASPDSAVLVVSPVLDHQAQRRFGGCLEDARLERHRLTVVDTVLVPVEEGSPVAPGDAPRAIPREEAP
jgi:hypothetical protein